MGLGINQKTLAVAVAALLCCGQAVVAQCDSGNCGTYFGGGCGAGGCNGSFGYPGGDCGGGYGTGRGLGHGHHDGPLRQHAQHLAEIQRRDFARNQAWPKPFDCADRQLYFAMWDSMLENGYRWNCVFSALHFDADTNELNQAGVAKVAGIFRNNPMAQKVALVQNEGNSAVVDARLKNLQSTITKWYGDNSFLEVALTDQFPGQFLGARAERLNLQAVEQASPPLIPVASGTGSTSNVGNN